MGWLYHDDTYHDFFVGNEYPNAIYTHCYDPAGTRLFTAGDLWQMIFVSHVFFHASCSRCSLALCNQFEVNQAVSLFRWSSAGWLVRQLRGAVVLNQRLKKFSMRWIT